MIESPQEKPPMPKFTVERSHTLSAEDAKARLQSLSDKLSEKYGLRSEWKSSTLAEVKGTGASGTITCEPGKVSVMIDLSFALTPLKGKIEDKVKRELESALA
jgi:putative polyhydroxyalkanoate system protein